MKTVTFEELNNKSAEIFDRAFNTITGLAANGIFADDNKLKIMYCEELTRMAYYYMEMARYELPRPLAIVLEDGIESLKNTMKQSVHDSFISATPKRKSLFA